MLPALILALAALGSALLRLWAYRAQLLEMARVLEETPPESNLRLTVRTFGMASRRLCRAVNQRLEEGRQLRLETQKREQELKYTMTCISHDIRTPLAGPWATCSCWRKIPSVRRSIWTSCVSGWKSWKSF